MKFQTRIYKKIILIKIVLLDVRISRPFLKKNQTKISQEKNLIKLIEVTYTPQKPKRIVPQIPKFPQHFNGIRCEIISYCHN